MKNEWLKKLLNIKPVNSNETKKYILWVTTKDTLGYSSRWHGWSRDLKFTYEEALKEKERISERYYDVQIHEL